MSLGFSVFLLWRGISPRNLAPRGYLAALFLACSTTCFVLSLESNPVANTLVIIATSPLLAAILAQVFLGERVERATWIAIIFAFIGVALSLRDNYQGGSLTGSLFAAGSALSMASHFTALRWWKSEYAPLSVWGAGWIAALFSLLFAQPTAVENSDIPYLLLLGLLVLPAAFGLMAVGPKYLPAPEVGLLLLGETALGPLWVFLVLKERPGSNTLWGAVLVILTLGGHALYRRTILRRQ